MAAAVHRGAEPAVVMLEAACLLGDREFPRLAALAASRPGVGLPPPPTAEPDLVGRAYEATLGAGHRRAAGAHYTPARVADRLAAIALEGVPGRPTVCDPACGGGAFLLGAARALAGRGIPRQRIVEELLHGIDLDPVAVAVAEAALVLWSGVSPGDHLLVADGLVDPPAGRFDAVVGNPPFQSQLSLVTARDRHRAGALRTLVGAAARGYADTAAVFLAVALGMVRPGGRVVMVQPLSMLASRDAAGVRRAALDRAALEGVWVAAEPVFSASVRVCAPVLRVGHGPTTEVRRWTGSEVERAAPVALDAGQLRHTWAPLAADPGVPVVELGGRATLGDLAGATAGFRDQFYGLVPFVVDRLEADDGRYPKLVTSGLVEPGRLAWGERPTRFSGARFTAPRLDLAALRAAGPERLVRWVQDRLVPKVVVATQTRVVEAAVDTGGVWVPSTPVLSVEVRDRADLWRVAAVLLAPPVTAWALRTYGGTALSSDAIKLSAAQVRAIPLPPGEEEWEQAAALVQSGAVVETGAAMTRAYGADDAVFEWWAARARKTVGGLAGCDPVVA